MRIDKHILCSIFALVFIYVCICALTGCKSVKTTVKTDGETTITENTKTTTEDNTQTRTDTNEETTTTEVQIDLQDGAILTTDEIVSIVQGSSSGSELKAKSITIKKSEKQAATATKVNADVQTTNKTEITAETQEKTAETNKTESNVPRYINIAMCIFTILGVVYLIYCGNRK